MIVIGVSSLWIDNVSMNANWSLLRTVAHRGQRSIFTLIANSGSLHKFDNSCTARIFSLHDFQTILNANSYGWRGLSIHKIKIHLPPDPGPVSRPQTPS